MEQQREEVQHPVVRRRPDSRRHQSTAELHAASVEGGGPRGDAADWQVETTSTISGGSG